MMDALLQRDISACNFCNKDVTILRKINSASVVQRKLQSVIRNWHFEQTGLLF